MAETENIAEFDYTFVDAVARIALYDDLKSAPRITKIEPAATSDYIEHLTTTIYEQSHLAGGKIPYSVIREVSENFIHAQFREIVVSILDAGNTIRFADQGPGIREKEKAQQPGFSSAVEPMKDYIRGVGSGFPIVRDYLDDRKGSIAIEDNLVSGAVITISLAQKAAGSHELETGDMENIEPPPNAAQPYQPQPVGGIDAVGIGARGAAPIAAGGLTSATGYGPGTAGAIASGTGGAAGSVPVTAGVAFIPHIPLSEREQAFMKLLLSEGELGVTELHNLTDLAPSTVHNTLRKLSEAGLVTMSTGKKRSLTEIGYQLAATL